MMNGIDSARSEGDDPERKSVHPSSLILHPLLFAFLGLTYAYFYQSSQHNEAARFDQTRSILEKGVLYIDGFARYNSADVVTIARADGTSHVYPNKAPGTSLFAVPFFGFWMLALKPLPLADWVYWHLVAYLTTLTTVGLLSALAALAMFGVLRRITGESFFSLLAVVALWLGTICFPFSTLFFSHQQAAAQLALAFWILFRLRHDGPENMRRPLWQAAVAGWLCGVTVATEYPTLLLVALLCIYFILTSCSRRYEDRRRPAGVLDEVLPTDPGQEHRRAAGVPHIGGYRLGILFFGGMLLGLAILAAYNLAAFGKVFYVPYEAYAQAGSAAAFPGHAQGYVGVHWPGWQKFWEVLKEITIRPQRGLLYIGFERGWVYACNPVLWLAVPGVVWLFLRRPYRVEAVLVTAMALAYLTFNACYGDSIVYWGGAWSVGPRHLVPMLPFLALPLALAARKLWFVFAPLLLISMLYMLLATAVEPRVPYEHRNPSRDLFLPKYLSGNFSLNRLGLFDPQARPLAADSTAFNLGEIAGLPGTLQLLPLLLFWLAAGNGLIFLGLRNRRPAANDQPSAVSDQAAATHNSTLNTYKRLSVSLLWSLFVLAIAIAPPVHANRQQRAMTRGGGLLGKYYPNNNWKAPAAFERKDATLDFDWTRDAPLPGPFSVEWFGTIRIDRPGRYEFSIESDDGSWLAFDNKIIINNGGIHPRRRMATSIEIPRSGVYPFAVRYFNEAFGGMICVRWTPPRQWEQIIPSDALSPLRVEGKGK